MTKEKLTAKQTIQGNIDLSTFIEGAATSYERTPPPEPRIVTPKSSNSLKAGRPAEIRGEPRKAVINVKFTEKEKNSLKKQAGGVPLSSYIRTLLKNVKAI